MNFYFQQYRINLTLFYVNILFVFEEYIINHHRRIIYMMSFFFLLLSNLRVIDVIENCIDKVYLYEDF